MVMEHLLGLMEISMMGNGRTEKKMAKEHSLGQMEESMKGNSWMVSLGTEQEQLHIHMESM